MAINFKKIPSAIELPEPEEPIPHRTVSEEILYQRHAKLPGRTYFCKPIEQLYKDCKQPPPRYMTRHTYICGYYKAKYCCKHTGNIVLDRDVLTKDEHICYIAQPKKNHGAEFVPGRIIEEKIPMQNVTARIVELATPNKRTLEYAYTQFGHLMRKRAAERLRKQIEEKPLIPYTTVAKAIAYIEEERRLARVAKRENAKRCRRIQREILKQQRQQIRKMICVIFEEMKDFLLNDQFVIDDCSTLGAVILQEIRNFTDNEFIMTKNLREYQKIMANNLAVWINVFITNLDIRIEPTTNQYQGKICEEPRTLLPIEDYISLSHAREEIECETEADEELLPPECFENCEEEGLSEYNESQ